jgi:DNA-binding transcriptional ArsR family regulator
MKKGLNEVCYGFFSSLANPTRLAILERLRDGEMNVSGLAAELGLEQSMVSHNLKILERCKFVVSEKMGKEKYVSLNGDTMEVLIRVVERHASRYCNSANDCPLCS